MRKTFLSILLLLALSGLAFPSALSTAAASMNAGEWKELSTLNLSGDLLYMNCNSEYWWADMAATWSNYLTWNPATQDIMWVGAPHMGPFQHLRYNETTNGWTNETNVPDCMRLPNYEGCFKHGYDLGTIDPEKGIFYYKSTSTFFSYVIATKTWAQWSISQFSSDRSDAMAFFTPLKKLCHVIGGTVRLIDPVSHAVETVASGLSMGTYDNTAEYSLVHRKVYFGGAQGSKAFYSLDSLKKVTRLADAPEAFDDDHSSLACDPVTGNPLILSNANNYYVYSAVTNAWTQLASPPATLNAPSSAAKAVMATGIPEYGVVFYMSPNLKKVYLYKHAALGSQAEAPATRVTAAVFNLPNPAAPSAVMALKVATGPALSIHDSRGRLVADASRLPVGVYVLEIHSGNHRSVRRIAVIR
jgi:hypothetical protein